MRVQGLGQQYMELEFFIDMRECYVMIPRNLLFQELLGVQNIPVVGGRGNADCYGRLYAAAGSCCACALTWSSVLAGANPNPHLNSRITSESSWVYDHMIAAFICYSLWPPQC